MLITDVNSANAKPVVALPRPGPVCTLTTRVSPCGTLWLLTTLHLELELEAFWGWVPSA